jgi:hypothetical protein
MRLPTRSCRLPNADFYLDGGITMLDHGHGVSTCYIHQSKILVKLNQRVSRGPADRRRSA